METPPSDLSNSQSNVGNNADKMALKQQEELQKIQKATDNFNRVQQFLAQNPNPSLEEAEALIERLQQQNTPAPSEKNQKLP